MSSSSRAEPGARPDDHAPRRRVALLGSTGSIGRQTLDVLGSNADAFEVVALAAGSNASLLTEQADRFRPTVVALGDDAALGRLDLPPGTERVAGADALEALAT